MGELLKGCVFEENQNLVLELSKHSVLYSLKKRDFDASDFYTFGFFDHLDVFTVNTWGDYTPRGIAEKEKRQKSTRRGDSDQKSESCSYRNVHSDSDDLHMIKLFNGQNIAAPTTGKSFGNLLGLLLINLHTKFTKQYSPSQFVQEFISATKCQEQTFRDRTLAVIYNTLGYYDLCIIFVTTDWSEVNIFDKEIKKFSGIVANSHIIYGMKTPMSELLNDSDLDILQKFTVRFRLRTGKTQCEFENNLKNKMQESLNQGEIGSCVVQSTHGRSDCLLLGEISLRSFFKLYQLEGVFHPESEFYKGNIETLRTSLRFDSSDVHDNDEHTEAVEESPFVEKMRPLWEEMDDISNKILDVCNYKGLHTRPIHSLAITLRECRILTSLPYANTIVLLLRPILIKLSGVLKQWMKVLEECDSEKLNENQCDQFLQTMDNIRKSIGQYIVDLLHSDRFYMEGITLMHRSIASATKLLFAYNSVLNRMSELVKSASEDLQNDNPDASYHFLVTSGGADITTSTDLMNNIPIHLLSSYRQGEPLIDESRIIQLRLSERSIFDIPGTLFRVFHEGFHFFGNRNREMRANCIVNAFAACMANQLSQNLRALVNIELPNEAQMTSEVVNDWRKIQIEIVCEASQELEKNLFDGILHEIPSLEYEDSTVFNYYREVLMFNLEKEIVKYFWPKPFSLSDATRLLYTEILKAVDSVYEKLSKHAQTMGIYTRTFLDRQATQYYIKQLTSGTTLTGSNFWDRIDQTLLQNIYNIQSSLCNTESIETSDWCNIPDMLDMIYESFSEAYCDSMACTTLGVGLADYLLAFLFEQWKIDFAMPKCNESFILRMGATLTVCFGINAENGLLEVDKKQIRECCDFYNMNHKWHVNLDAEPIIQIVDEVLADYCSSPLRNSLETYLKACCDKLEKIDLSLFRSLYQNVHKTDIISALKAFLDLTERGDLDGA